MFHFPGCPPMNLWIQFMVTGHYPSRVPPFGNLRIKAYLQLPEAYRSLSRPSSAISAMASTLRSCSLDLALIVYLFLRLLRKVHNPLCFISFALISRRLTTSLLDDCDWNLTLRFLYRLSFLFHFPVQFSRCVEDFPYWKIWWAGVDSNHRPLAYQASALTG